MKERLLRSTEFGFLGLASVIVQIVFMRRLIGLFGGSEVLYALVFSIWLVQTGFWSWLADRCRFLSSDMSGRKLALPYLALAVLVLYYPLLAPLKGALFGEIGAVPLSSAAAFAFFVLILPTVYPGMAFAGIFRVRKVKDPSSTVGEAYFFDSVGFAVGGAVLTVLFSVSGKDWALILLIAAAATARFLLIWFHRRLILPLLVFAVLASVSAHSIGGSVLRWYGGKAGAHGCSDAHFYAIERSDESAAFSAFSPYGHVRAMRDSLALNVYYNSQRISTYPDPSTEELIALPLAMCRNVENVCVIGNSCDGKAVFAAHDSSIKVVQVEPDPALCYLFQIGLKNAHLSQGAAGTLNIVNADPVDFLYASKQKFDLIYVNYSDVSAVAEGIYFTRQFFRLVSSRLSTGGVVAFSTRCGENFVQQERLAYVKNLLVTLEAVFPKVEIIPGEYAMMVGGMPESRPTTDAREILERLQPYYEHLTYVSEAYLPDRLSEFRKEKLDLLLDDVRGTELTAARPNQHLLSTILEMDKFSGIDSKALRALESQPAALTFLLVMLPFLLLMGVASIRRTRLDLLVPAFFSGWWGISFEIMLMIVYQSLMGNLFSRLGLLAGLFMLGIAAGAFAGTRLERLQADIRKLLRGFLVSGALLAVVIGLTSPMVLENFDLRVTAAYAVYVSAFMAGIVPGAVFNLSAARFKLLRGKDSPGRLYGADLFGAAAGGLLTTVLVLPLLGIQCGFLALALMALLLVAYSTVRL